MFENYEHHGKKTWVRSDLKGKHREFCLCYDCKLFRPNTQENCKIAQANFEFCVANNVTLPVWECEIFVEEK